MERILSCLVFEHDYRWLALALLICAGGSILAMRLFARTRRTTGIKRMHWIFLSGVVCGAVVWTTHFAAMLGYKPPLAHAYEPVGTFVSLFLAIGFCTAAMFIVANTMRSPMIEAGGALLGAGIAVMHYTGMSAFHVAGYVEYDPAAVTASVILGCFFGAIMMNRIARPVTRFCKYGGSISLALAIATMHFTAMGAVTIVPDISVIVPADYLTNTTLMICILGVMLLIMGSGVSSYIIDLKSQEEAVRHYKHLALHDAVTGLPNRTYLSNRLTETIANAADDTSRLAVLAIDLDRFKDINDVHGHESGDHVLKVLAERLSATLGKDEFLARVGGDEFVAVKQYIYTKGQAVDFARQLRERICEAVEHRGTELTVGASIGISLYPDDGGQPEELVNRADLAMYRAKQAAGDKICIYEASMDEASRLRSALAMELRNAIERDEMELYYQPQNDVATGELIGFEALLRWMHPERGVVSPADFIPIAEETGLIMPLGEWVLREACREAAQWRAPLKVAVNVAPAQIFQSDLPRIVHETLLETGLPAARLELEITESSILGDHQHALHVIRKLKSFGVKIAMDDYGTGYSSLSTLKSFPFDKIKIDRSFVSSVESNDHSGAIIRATLLLAESLRIPVLAEGVETAGHLDFLRREGCKEAQGYYFGRPLAVGDARAMIAARETAAASEPAWAQDTQLAPALLKSA